MTEVHLEELNTENMGEVRSLILAGLREHWGEIDETLNPELDNMLASYRGGRTVLLRDVDGSLVATGTIMPRDSTTAEIMRMSVAREARRQGLGKRIVNELVTTASAWGLATVILETSTAWSEVIDFYVACGFTVTHVADGDFGSDTWFMLDISDS